MPAFGGHDVNGDVLGVVNQLVRQRAPEEFGPPAAPGPSYHDLSDVLKPGEAQKLLDDVGGNQRLRLVGAQSGCKLERLVKAMPPFTAQALARTFDGHDQPGRTDGVRQTLRMAHDRRGDVVGADADEDAFPCRPRALDPAALHAFEQVAVDALGGPPQCQFPQRHEVVGTEEVVDGARRRVLHIDLALGQPLEELVRRQVDQDKLVRLVEHRIGHRLAHADPGDPLDDVIEAFEMLDVQRRPDVDPRRQQFLNVLPSLRMAAARGIRVGVFINQDEPWVAFQGSVEIELLHHPAPVGNGQAGQDLEAVQTGPPFPDARGSRRGR